MATAESAKGWFARNIFDPSDGKSKPPASPGGAPPIVGVSPVAPVLGAVATASTPITYGLDPQMVQDIQKVIERRPTPFTALEQNAQKLADVIPDEVQRTKAAFKMLPGTTGPAVISSIDLHIRDIEQEKTGFAETAKQAVQKKAGGLRNEAESLLAQNKADEATIQQLEQQITNLRVNIQTRAATAAQKQTDAASEEANINSKVTQFTAAADAAIATLNTKKAQLQPLLA